jgi:hypothetical protein
MSRQFFARVHFPGVEESDEAYETLADEMAKQAFGAALKLPNRAARLPPGTFVAPVEEIGSAEEALRRVQRAAKSTGLAAAIVVFDTDQPVQTYGLDTAPAPAATGG